MHIRVLDKILLLSPKKYTFKEDKNNSVKIGLIAQEVQTFFPELVHKDSNGILSLNYQALASVLVQAIKEQ